MRRLLLFLCCSTIYASSILPCYQECESRLSSDEEDFDVACNETCKVQKCRTGCDLMTRAISSSCHEVCEENKNIIKNKLGLYCIRGCNIAINLYLKAIEDEFGTPAQPYLVAETRTNTSIMIRWVPSQYSNISYLVQWRFDSSHQADWEYYRPTKLLKQSYLNVESLHPYTKYRFRVAWIILKNYPPLFSKESIVISTLPYGAPSTPPVITCLTAVSCTKVSLSFDPPQYPNGLILSYVLYIYEFPYGNAMIKDISDTTDGLHYMINGLKPNTTYKILLSTRNSMGEGPMAEKKIQTLSKETSSRHHPPAFLVFGTKHSVLKQGLRILDDAQILYKVENQSNFVTGISLDVKRNLFFVSESGGIVNMVDLKATNKIKKVISDKQNKHPTKLSIDWLNDKLYLAEEKQISRCNIKGNKCETVLNNMKLKAKDLHVDPLNGYLYFTATNSSITGGLYRIDLEQFESGCTDFQKAQLIINDNSLTAFAVDHKNFRLLLPSTINNTVVSVALDGSDVADIRENSQTPQYENVKSIAVHRDLFYWTTGNNLFGEEYHQIENKYYQNVFFVGNGPFQSLNIYHPDSQPYPVPLNPVESLEGIFGCNKAKIRWSNPRLLGGQGKGSWQKWSYEIVISSPENNHTLDLYVNNSNCEVQHLKPNTTYSVKVRAYSIRGKGPWSSEIQGITIREYENSSFPYVIWGAREGLLRSDVIGEDVELLIPKININNAHITDICWYNQFIFINTNTSFVYVYNFSISDQPSLTRLPNISFATSIAIEWFAPKLYWSSPSKQMIFRSNLDGSLPESLPIVTMAKEIAIDSKNAFLYWATSHSVERSRLNGKNHYIYMKNALFSGKHVMGLSLDFNNRYVYYMVRSFEASILYRSCMPETNHENCYPNKPEILGSLSEIGLHGPVSYFANKLFYLHESQKAFVSDMRGHNFAQMEGLGLDGLTSIEIIDQFVHQYPEGLDETSIKVVPLPVDADSIQVNGKHDFFNIKWQPDTIINYGEIFYEISVYDGDEVYSLITNETVFVYPTMKRLPPFTLLTVAIQKFTYFASSKKTIVGLHSPMSIPSHPIHPRIFITHKSSPLHDDQEILADFRWSPPERANGIIINYRIICWHFENNTMIFDCDMHAVIDGKTLEYKIKNLLSNTTYYFQAQAITDAGVGEPSITVEAQTSVEKPVPQLLLAKSDSVKVADIDIHEEKLLYGKATHPAAIAYLAQERRVFWMEQDAVMVSSIDGANASLIKHLSSEGTCLTVDWIGKQLFWAEVDKKEQSSKVFSVDLSYDSYPKEIFNSPSIIRNLEVEPFSGSLIWTLASGNNCSLMISDISGSNIQPFFSRNFEYQATSSKKIKRSIQQTKCNCNPYISVGQAITIDSASTSQPRLLFIDGKFGHIFSSDIDGCICDLVLNATENKNSGLPPTSITVDSTNIYWLNKALGKVYSITKSIFDYDTMHFDECFHPNINSEDIRGARSIRAIGNHLQPYPDPSCLISQSYTESPTLLSRSSDSLTLYLPPVYRPKFCNRISTPSVFYTVFYGRSSILSTGTCLTENKNFCKILTTHNNTITIRDLSPYTNYSINIAVKNYYSDRLSELSKSVTYQTEEGAPSSPMNVTAKAVSPFKIFVFWKPPLLPNGEHISYGVQWKVNSTMLSMQPQCRLEPMHQLFAVLETTNAGQDHFISVRAYSSNCKLYTDSEDIIATTYSLPNNITFQNSSSSTITILWMSPDDDSIFHYTLEYSEGLQDAWISNSNAVVTSSTFYMFTVENLTPKTKYHFRLILTYKDSENTQFVWPQNFVSEFSTTGDIPSLPGLPLVKPIGREVYQVSWEEAHNNGYLDMIYEVQIRSDEETGEWKYVTNSTTNQWIVNNFSGNTYYEFRVRAINDFGYSNFSYSEKLFFLPEAGALIDQADDTFGIIASSVGIVVLLAIFFTTFYIIHLKREKCKKILQEVSSNQLVPDLELATLQDLPLHANFIHQTNALYNMNDLPADEEFLSLPQITKDQITPTRFLGSGAFGEVYEGIAYGLKEDAPILKIAIKTLKKGATDHEKDEFLKEAKLMSNFKHEHILQLLGVCFDNPNFIILELMEGGDLLSFLRSNRPMNVRTQNSNLTLDDLLRISIDVAKGCKYLEDLHFVHRDLAARNCLVSSYDRSQRIVKIGDFGLARDIYRSDYYRKEGEGLLPVRWMAPESLIYGIFTNQSDVWAFGVLLWEVMTFGQQPYQAQSNMEVLYYVRAGNHLTKPKNCPDEMHEIMESCWSYNADDRPTFHYCLHELQELRNKLTESPNALTTVYNYNYFNEAMGFVNLGYSGSVMNGSVSSSESEISLAATAGNYIGRYDGEENDENKTVDQNFDSRSTQSYPTTMSEQDTSSISLRRSLSWTDAMFGSEGSQLIASARNKSRVKPAVNRYLEILGDNEDADGYQLPLNFSTTTKMTKSPYERKLNFVTQSCEITNGSEIQLNTSSTPAAACEPAEICLKDTDISSDPRELVKKYSSFCNEMDRILHPDDLDRSTTPSSINSENCCLGECDSWSNSTASTYPIELTQDCHRSYDLETLAHTHISGIVLDTPDSSCC